jgi:hypothetical protein
VDTSYLPDVERDRKFEEEKAKLASEWIQMQNKTFLRLLNRDFVWLV